MKKSRTSLWWRKVDQSQRINEPLYQWDVILECGHRVKIMTGNYPPPDEMRCHPCEQEAKKSLRDKAR